MNNPLTIDQLQDMWQQVSLLHKGQTYGGSRQGEHIEYINHIASVVFEIMHAAAQTTQFDSALAIQCALLHDTLEDTSFSEEALARTYGNAVLQGVLALTKNTSLEKAQQMTDSLERIKKQPKEVWAVKLADRICNLYAPPYYWDAAKKAAYLEEAQVIYDHLKDGNDYLAKRLLAKMEAYTK